MAIVIGLQGEEIPLAARIVSVADTYDAMISKRVYKDAYDSKLAEDIILEEFGKQFDPVVVDAFMACRDKFREVCQSADRIDHQREEAIVAEWEG